MLLPISNAEIKTTLFSIPDNKAPGPDGYNAFFFKKCWSIIRDDFIAATRYFFTHNSLPRYVNATRVALVPKVANPDSMNDFRPISCCNVLCKCISKIIVSRLKHALDEVIGPSQFAFLSGRNISDAIMLTHELMHNNLLESPSFMAIIHQQKDKPYGITFSMRVPKHLPLDSDGRLQCDHTCRG
jgi:hypothetical protein